MSLYKLAYEISPIVLTGGLAKGIPGGMMPIVLLTQSIATIGSIIGGGGASLLNLDSYFAHFRPLPGGTLNAYDVGEYPFANQAVAANAMIAQPLRVSFLMLCPIKDEGGFVAKLATITALKAALDNHVQSGGTFTCATPSYIYTNCLFLGMKDASEGETNQPQVSFQLDFYKPLLTKDDAQTAESLLISKITGGGELAGNPPGWSGVAAALGVPPSLTSLSTVAASSGLVGTGVAGAAAVAKSAGLLP